VIDVARDLVGKLLVKTDPEAQLILRVVETEAYSHDDPASHSHGGPRGRNTVMFRAGGIAYVYIGYGVHHCLNVVTGPAGMGEAVLIRSAEPLVGAERMWRRRWPDRPLDPSRMCRLAAGPGNLTRALGITKSAHNGVSLLHGCLTVCDGNETIDDVVSDVRIGITRATERPWRFLIHGNRCVSRRARPPASQ
jgi:DNA-3-methyladenine glycosylase